MTHDAYLQGHIMTAMIPPIELDNSSDNPELSDLLDFLGYRPNALFTMARKPGLLSAVLELVRVALRGPGLLAPELRFLVACEACRGAKCFYSATHMVHAAHHLGISWEKLALLPQYETHGIYEPEERAALRLATAGATLPAGNTESPFIAASQFFNHDELAEIVGAIALFGIFNRWNSLVGSELESLPAQALDHVPWLVDLT